jgi:hypothetical protein
MLLVGVVLAVGSCVSSATFKPATLDAGGRSKASLYASSLAVLSDRGLSAQSKDADAGVIVTEWEERTFLGTEYRYRWHVKVSDGRVRVDSQCQYQEVSSISDAKSWVNCPSATDEGDRSRTARQLANGIVSGAKREQPAAPPPPAPVASPAANTAQDAGAPAPSAPLDAGP